VVPGLLPALPDELSGWIGVAQIPAAPPFPEHLWSRKAGIITWCYSGPHDRADAALAPFATSAIHCSSGWRPMPYSVLQSAFDPLIPKGLQWYWKTDFFEEITDEAIGVHRRYGEAIPTPLSTMHMYPSAVRRPGCPRTAPLSHTAMAAG
jgi:hypothetical protein